MHCLKWTLRRCSLPKPLTETGYAIVQTHFPDLKPLLETYYLTCLLHDLGTITEHMHGTHMSFEYYGAFKALNFLRDSGASKDQAEAVSEAIIRHADLGETGTLTSLGMLIQLSTVFGKFPSTFLLRCDNICLPCPEMRGHHMMHHVCKFRDEQLAFKLQLARRCIFQVTYRMRRRHGATTLSRNLPTSPRVLPRTATTASTIKEPQRLLPHLERFGCRHRFTDRHPTIKVCGYYSASGKNMTCATRPPILRSMDPRCTQPPFSPICCCMSIIFHDRHSHWG